MAVTKLANLINPQVFSDELTTKLGDKIKLYPLAYVESMEDEEGGVISVPSYTYVGDASIIGEGVAIDPKLLNQQMVNVPVKKVGEAFSLTDEAVKNGKGDPVGESEKQLLASIAGGVEKEMFAALETATLTYTTPAGGKIDGSAALNAIQMFGEDLDDKDGVLLVNPNQYVNIKRDTGFIDEELMGCEVIFSNRVPADRAYVVRPGAIGLYLGKAVQVETDRDILAKLTVISADEHFAAHLRDASKAVKITITA